MKIIIGEVGSGKTKTILKESQDKGAPILTDSARRKEKLCRQAGRHSFSTIFYLEGEISLVPRAIFLFLTPRTILFIGEDFELVCIP